MNKDGANYNINIVYCVTIYVNFLIIIFGSLGVNIATLNFLRMRLSFRSYGIQHICKNLDFLKVNK